MNSLTEIDKFLNGTRAVSFQAGKEERLEIYQWIENTLVKFSYALSKKKDRGRIRRYIQKITGYSRAQVTRYITQYIQTGHVKIKK